MKKLQVVLLAVVMVFAFAQVGAAKDAGGYMGLGVGQTKLDVSSADAEDPDQLDDTDTGIKIFGGYKVNPNFAVELGYIQMGEAVATFNNTPVAGQTSKITAESNSIFVAAMGILPIDKSFEFFGKLGFHFWTSDFTVSGGLTGSGDGDGTDLMYGFGLAYHFTDAVAARIEYENYTNVGDGATMTVPGMGTATMDGDDVSFMGLGVVFSF